MDRSSAALEAEWAARLAGTPFGAALERGAPLFIACGNPPQVAFATTAARTLFGADDNSALEAALFEGQGSAARRLARLAAETLVDAPLRLEFLRFFVARRPIVAQWLCGRLRRDGETFFIAADLAAGASETPADARAPPEAATAAPPKAPVPHSPPAADGSPRFVWRLDARLRFVKTDPALDARLGANAPRAGETLSAFLARAGVGPSGAMPDAVAARAPFSGLRVEWTEAGGRLARPARLSGAPVLAAGGRFEGYRGFGVFTGESLEIPVGDEIPAGDLKTKATDATPAEAAKPSALNAVSSRDASALVDMLRQRAPRDDTAAPPATAPALAIIKALASLLQPKADRGAAPADATPEPKSSASPSRPASGAEIVVLRPSSSHRDAPAADSVALTSQERDAFKEIARALGANVRGAPAALEPAVEEPAAAAPAAADLAALLDVLPIAALVIAAGAPVYVNSAWLELTGYSSLEDFCARGGLAAVFRGRDPQALAPAGETTGVPLVAASGEIVVVDGQTKPAVWDGAPALLVALRRSREADHQAELRALERESARHAARARDLGAALDVARDGMVRLDGSGRILGMSPSAEKWFGWRQNETAGESFRVLLAPDSQAAASAALDRLARGESGPAETLEGAARTHDGRLAPVRLDLARLANAADPEYVLLFADLTEREAAAEEQRTALAEAEKSNVAKTELLSRVSHEMRTPLHAVLGFAEVMIEERFGPVGNERYREYIRDIHASGRHVLSLTNDLLDLSRIELGKLDLQFSPVDANRVIRECVTLMQPQAARERVIMRLSLFDRLPNVMADDRSLRQILLNLMANAVKYNEPGGQVIVSTALDDAGSVVIRVRDTGVGMSESELAIALEPFRRVPGAKAVEGAGIGLPLTKALAEAIQADFAIKSRKDQGTLVEIAFPRRPAAQ